MNRFAPIALLASLLLALVLLIFLPRSGLDWWSDTARSTEPQRPEAQIHVLDLGYNMEPGSILHAAAERLATEVSEASGGRLILRLHPSQTLGTDQQMLEQARRGQLDMLLIPTSKLTAAVPEMQYLDLPFFFPSPDDFFALLDDGPGQALLGRLQNIGLVGMTFWGNGFKQLTANHPLLGPDDFAGLRVRIMKSRLLQEQFQALGAAAIPIEFYRIHDALRDGVVDAQENPLSVILSRGIHKVQSDLTLSRHAYLAYALTINQARLQQLPRTLQQLLLRKAREVTPWVRQATQVQEERILVEIRNSGIRVHELSAAARQQFSQRLAFLADLFEDVIGPDLLAETRTQLLLRNPPADALLVGLDVDLSGPARMVGISLQRGIRMGLEAAGEPTASGLRVLVTDNRGLPSRGRADLQQLAAQPAVIGVVEGGSSATLAAQLPLLERLQVPMISAWASQSQFYADPPNPYLFAMGTDNRDLSRFLVEVMEARGIRRMLLIREDSLWGDDLRERLNDARQQVGQGPVQEYVVTPQAVLDPGALKSGLTPAEVVVLAVRATELARVLNALPHPAPVPLVSIWPGPAGPAGEHLSCVRTWKTSPRQQALFEDYRLRYGHMPHQEAAFLQGYDAAMLIRGAIRHAQGRVDPVDREGFRQGLEAMRHQHGDSQSHAGISGGLQHVMSQRHDFFLSTDNCTWESGS